LRALVCLSCLWYAIGLYVPQDLGIGLHNHFYSVVPEQKLNSCTKLKISPLRSIRPGD
jgi:hypothetical protein